jgi:hypothetical protein
MQPVGAALAISTVPPGICAQTAAMPAKHAQLLCYQPATPGRAAIESYIARIFLDQHGAIVEHFLPTLLALACNGVPGAAVGIRNAGQGPLFVEHYLDRPVETELQLRGWAAGRERIIEIGNLVATRAGSSQLLFILLAELLHALGGSIAVFTATPQVLSLLGKLDCTLLTLCRADGARLGEQLRQWGSYYDAGPQVAAIDIQTAVPRLREKAWVARTVAPYADAIAAIAAEVR